ncbi:MAG: bifunctional demethylmenaquinone methyltransferase/2-methoxy-6-polyprenyl-1,4-benzoquinol methylase UbiE [Cryomorphaceae bacterium]|nr:bifunctional demethylmenaquinone methyltransferase/2-methoxy-6-polyprenyl-1,4-benzoquinol methylase UbiE [Cryomorphaceae bacterium]
MKETKEVRPYSDREGTKKEQVANMFDNIAHSYDRLNHILSLGIDKGWRRKLLKMAQKGKSEKILDVATGTGDLAIALSKLNPKKIIGVDISNGMLEIGRKKVAKRVLEKQIELIYGDSENLPFEDNSFDLVTVAFGVRNFENLEKGMREMLRVLKPGGQILVLEFSQPETFPFAHIYKFYFKYILPGVGRLLSKDASAYTYLPASVEAFPYGKNFTDVMDKCGYKNNAIKKLTLGVASIYKGVKPS